MKLQSYAVCLLLTLFIACSDNASIPSSIKSQAPDSLNEAQDYPIQVHDYENNIVSLAKHAERIISLSPHIIENIFSAGAGDKVIGTVSYSDYPEAAKAAPIIGNFNSINIERIIELKPDLIIAWSSGNPKSQIEHLRQLGFNVYIDEPIALTDIARSIQDIAILAGTEAVSIQNTKNFLKSLDTFHKMYKNSPHVPTFYQISGNPLQTISGQHIISNAINLCGGVNIFSAEPSIAPVVSIEIVVKLNPDVIFSSGHNWQEQWFSFPEINAVKTKQLINVNPDYLNRHTLRIIKGIRSICQHLDAVRSKTLKAKVL